MECAGRELTRESVGGRMAWKSPPPTPFMHSAAATPDGRLTLRGRAAS